MRDLQRLILDRLNELDLSFRDAARRTNGLVSHATINNISNGRHQGRVSDNSIRGLAVALDVPVSDVEEAYGRSIKIAGTEFRLPERSAKLTPRQRRLLVSIVDALLAAGEPEPKT